MYNKPIARSSNGRTHPSEGCYLGSSPSLATRKWLYATLTDNMKKINVQGTEISIISKDEKDYISLTDMLRAKDGEFFISDWLRNRNTVEFLGI